MKMPKLTKLTSMDDWCRVISNAYLIHGTLERPKVCRTADGFIIKWFYPRGGISTDRIYPYAKRFIKHSLQLEQKGIDSVHVSGWLQDPQSQAHIVLYPALEGMTVRAAMVTECAQIVMDSFIDFVVDCHERGVFFRGIHLGNVLVREFALPKRDAYADPDAFDNTYSEQQQAPVSKFAFSLIDVTDCKVKQGKLNRWERIRNLKHLFNNVEDAEFYADYGVQRFVDRYIELTGVEVEIKSSQPQSVANHSRQVESQHKASHAAQKSEFESYLFEDS